jgi:hypothetical protein
MTGLSLLELEAERDRLYAQLSMVGDFRRGSVSENYRKCGKPNCACAAPDHPGHGPRFVWTRSAGRRKTAGRQLAAAEVEKVRRELARHAEFAAISEQIAEVNEKICEARPVAGTDAPVVQEGDKVDDDGYPVRDPGSSSYIATFGPAAVFAGLVKAGGIRRGADHVRQLTILGDGAAWIWNIATAKFPEVL